MLEACPPMDSCNPPPPPVVNLQNPGRVTNQLHYLENVVLKALRRHEYLWPFQSPVDAEVQLPDYYSIISSPMDLGTIMQRLQNKFYWRGRDSVQDFPLMFNNCCIYNQSKVMHPSRMEYKPVAQDSHDESLETSLWSRLDALQTNKLPPLPSSLSSPHHVKDVAAPPAGVQAPPLSTATSHWTNKDRPQIHKKAVVSWPGPGAQAVISVPIKSSKELFQQFRKAGLEQKRERVRQEAQEKRRRLIRFPIDFYMQMDIMMEFEMKMDSDLD